MKFSASQLKNWSKCQLQSKFKYIDNLPDTTGSSAWFGSAVHEALDQFHKGKTEEEAIQIFMNIMNGPEPDYWNRTTTLTGFKDLGPRMIREYCQAEKWKTSDVSGSEIKFMVDIGDHQLSGIVDYLELPHDHSKLKIVDFKTGKRPIKDTLYLDIQFGIYSYASYQKEFWCGHPDDPEKYPGLPNGEELFEYFKDIPREMIWYDLKKNEEVSVGGREMRDYARIYRLIEQVARAIEFEVYVPTIDGDTCTFCDFKDICPVYFSENE